MRTLLLAVALAGVLAGCARDGGPLLSLHVGHDFSEAPREHEFYLDERAARLRAHLRLSPAAGDGSCGETDAVAIRVVGPQGEAANLTTRPDECRPFASAELAPTPGRWVVRFEGRGALLGGADVTAHEAGKSSFRVPR